MNKILEYDLFVFDFDGTIMDTEDLHYKSWVKALENYNKSVTNFTMDKYHEYFHSLKSNNGKTVLKLLHEIDNYDEIYELKQSFYKKFIYEGEDIKFIDGMKDFLEFIIQNNKKFVIVSNTSDKFIEIFKKKFDIINKADKIYTKESFVNRKPNPECYLKVVNDYKNYKKIGFEDSLIGIHSLYQVNDITPVLLFNNDYFYSNYIVNNYKKIILLDKVNITNLEYKLSNFSDENNYLFINQILNNNIDQLNNNYLNMSYIINQITTIINNLTEGSHIYLSGMGKSGYVCKKSASTWQSLSIKCSYIDLPNLPHGDFGIFNDNDILILISNSGDTEEIVYVLKYLKYNLKKKITTISIVANKDSKMEKFSNFTYLLSDIKEADNINMTPSTSSLIFMALLDGIAINLKQNITKEEFRIAHPGGSLGKREN